MAYEDILAELDLTDLLGVPEEKSAPAPEPEAVPAEPAAEAASEPAAEPAPTPRRRRERRRAAASLHKEKSASASGASDEFVPKEEKAAAPRNPRRRPKKKKYAPRWWLLVFLWVAIALPELILHVTTAVEGALFNSGLLLCVLFAGVPALLVYGVTLLVPNRKVNFGITVGVSALMMLLCASQVVYYTVFNTYYGVYSMTNGGAAFQFVDTILTAIWQKLFVILLIALPLIAVSVLGLKVFSFKPMKKWQLALGPLGAAVVLQLLLVLLLPIFGGTDAMSAYDLYHKNTDSYYSINRLGLTTAFRLDLTRLLTGFEPGGDLVIETPGSSGQENPGGDTQGGTDSTGGTAEPVETTVPYDTSPNVAVNLSAMINRTTNTKYQDMHKYFNNRTPSNKNAKTGMFEGCNLILITAEAFSHLAVDEERTPTLYKMIHEGFNFTNYYVPDWGVSTTDGEYAFLTGTVPKAGVWSFKATAVKGEERAMPLTMAQQLIKLGYSAYAYHGHTYNYYSRNLYLENLGYTYRALGQGLDVKDTWPESDIEVVDLSTADYVNKEPFTAYYMSISGHRNFSFTGNYISYKNKAAVADEPYSENVRAYLACQLEFEYSMELLLERLEEAGVLENTVIVITADHYPNGLTIEEMSELAGHTIEENFEVFKNQCIIYKPGMTPETIDEPCSALDLLPTLSNLFGLEFDSRLYMGRDIFSDAEPFVMFRDRSWITDKCSYNADTKEVISFTGEEISDSYVKNHSTDLNNRFTISTRILDYDYWKVLFGAN